MYPRLGGVTFMADCEVTRYRPIIPVYVSWWAIPFGEVVHLSSLEVSLPSFVTLVWDICVRLAFLQSQCGIILV